MGQIVRIVDSVVKRDRFVRARRDGRPGQARPRPTAAGKQSRVRVEYIRNTKTKTIFYTMSFYVVEAGSARTERSLQLGDERKS